MGFTSIERPDVTALDVLISNWGDLPVSENERKKHTGDRYQPLLPLLKKYRKSIKNGCVTTQYEYSADSVISGRPFARSPSLQGLKRWVRHTIATGYHDYDIVNCHPNIFVQYCAKKGWDTSPFEMYLTQRDSCLQELMDKNGITRDEAKTVVLSILNGGSKPYNALASKPTWLTLYKLSVEVIQKKFMSDPENASIVANVKSRKTYNIGGSVMNHVLCNVENSILMKAIELLRVKEPVLVFDGFMARDFFGAEELKKLQDDILEATGYNLTWIEKPMSDGLDLSGFSVIEDTIDGDIYSSIKEKFEKEVSYIRYPNTFFVIDTEYGPRLAGKDHLKDLYAHLKVPRGKVEQSFVSVWLEDPEHRAYDHMEFLPELPCPENVKNTWVGFNIPKKNEGDPVGDHEPFLDLIDILVNFDKVAKEYIIQWVAHIFQKPGVMPRTAPVFKGAQGCGKNSFTEVLKKLLGKQLYFETSNPANDLFGRFSTYKQNKLCLVINESDAKETFPHNSKIKDYITNTEMNIEAKNVCAYTLNSFLRLIFISNEDTPLKVEHSDRRLTIFEASSKRKGDTAYWKKFYTWLSGSHNIRAVYDHLMSVKLTLDLEEDRPLTDAYFDVQENCLPREIKWLVNMIVDEFPAEWVSKRVSNKTLFSHFSRSLPSSYETSTERLGKFLKKMNIPGMNKGSSNGVVWDIDRAVVFKWLRDNRYTREITLSEPVKDDYRVDDVV